MCGIFAYLRRDPLDKEDVEWARGARNGLQHRGPDGVGEWIDEDAGVYLGHTRLAVLDPTPASDQPMERDGDVIVTNGEIYNYRSLRDQLEDEGYDLSTTGDTEVLLRGWQAWGRDVLDRVDAMFGSVYWDGDRAWAATDRFGEKQLYIADLDDGVAVSSELGVLSEAVGAEPGMSRRERAAYMGLGYVPAPSTAFDGIRRVGPATVVRIEDGQTDTSRYWEPQVWSADPSSGRLSERALDRIVDRLVGSLRRRIVSDVPLCLFLSSGIDSALVAALARHELDVELECLTVSFPQGDVPDEAETARAIADHLDFPHTVIESEDDPHQVDPEDAVELFGQPNDNLTALSVRQMSEIASDRGYKVALTGMGGDEMFFGYQKHAFLHKYRNLYALPASVRGAAGAMAGPLRHLVDHPWLGAVEDLFAVPDHDRYLALKNQPAISWLRRLPGFESWARDRFGDQSQPLDVQVPVFDLAEVLPNSHLPAMDVGSMREAVELRTPFLSPDVLDEVTKHPPARFLAEGQKGVLRRILRRYLPDGLVTEEKMGFIYPRGRMLAGPDRPPAASDIPEALQEEAWRRRDEGPGWSRIALRLVLLEAFESAGR